MKTQNLLWQSRCDSVLIYRNSKDKSQSLKGLLQVFETWSRSFVCALLLWTFKLLWVQNCSSPYIFLPLINPRTIMSCFLLYLLVLWHWTLHNFHSISWLWCHLEIYFHLEWRDLKLNGTSRFQGKLFETIKQII